MEPLWSLGLMSGTSLDGVDAAWLKTDGKKIVEVGEGTVVPYPHQLRERIRSILGQTEITDEIKDIERELTLFHAHVVKKAMKMVEGQHSFDIIGFHGQTISHDPPVTRQIGDGDLLAREVGVEVVYDFRTADVKHGGQGAPLVPIFHEALVASQKPEVILNVGGVANITWIQQGHPLISCDTGPGGALLDDWMLCKTGQSYDNEGQLGAQGTANETIVQNWMMHPYFKKTAPKSLDRFDFVMFVKDLEGCSPKDGAATLVEFTARSISHAIQQMPSKPENIYVTGGGRRNQHLMKRLASMISCPVHSVEALNWDGDLLEAYAFAYLAVRVKAGLPTSFPTTTGVSHPLSGGKVVALK